MYQKDSKLTNAIKLESLEEIVSPESLQLASHKTSNYFPLQIVGDRCSKHLQP